MKEEILESSPTRKKMASTSPANDQNAKPNASLLRKLVIKIPHKTTTHEVISSRIEEDTHKEHFIVVVAKASDTIRYIKSMIETKIGTQREDFYLMDDNGKLLADSRSLKSLDIASESTLHVFRKPRDDLSILVRIPNQRAHTLEVKSMSLASDVKLLVESLTGTPTEDMTLVYYGQCLDDSTSLASYNVKNHSILDLRTSFKISVTMTSGRTITFLELKPSDVNNILTLVWLSAIILLFFAWRAWRW